MDKVWKPTRRQEDFLSLPDSLYEALYGGAAGGGKTETLLMLPIARGFYRHPRFKMLFLRRTFPELDNEVIPRSKDMGFATIGTYADQKKRWTFNDGGILQFGHCENEKDVYRYDTSEYNIIAFDELTSFTEFQYMYLAMSRCRSSSPDLPAFVRSGTNPGNIGHGFVRKRFVEPCREGYKILRERRELHGQMVELRRIFIPSKAQDNDYLMQADPGYINRLNALPAADRAAKLEGDWWTFAGQVFDDWRIAPFPDEPQNACHVIKPFDVPEFWPRVLSIDWGFSAHTIAGWYAINPLPDARRPAKIVKYREHACIKTKISTWATDVARKSEGENLSDVVLDPSAWGNRGDEFTIQEQFTQYSGLRPRKADNDRIGGKQLLQDYLRWKPRPARVVPQEGFDAELAGRILRIKGPRAHDDYLSLFRPEPPETLLPRLQIFDTCEETIRAIPLCVYDKDNPEDVAEFVGDDPYDETRYALKACQHLLDTGKEEQQRQSQIAKACSDAERTGNMTMFYIKMANIEARDAIAAKGIRRYHNRRFRTPVVGASGRKRFI